MATGARSSRLSSSLLLLRIHPLSSSALSVLGRVIGLLDPPTRSSGSGWFSSERRPSFKIEAVPVHNGHFTHQAEEDAAAGLRFQASACSDGAPSKKKTREEIIDSYVKTLAEVLESEEEAKEAIYSVSTKYYFAFGCVLDEELSWNLRNLSEVLYVFPDSYLDVKKKDYREWLQINEKHQNRLKKQLIIEQNDNSQFTEQKEETEAA